MVLLRCYTKFSLLIHANVEDKEKEKLESGEIYNMRTYILEISEGNKLNNVSLCFAITEG